MRYYTNQHQYTCGIDLHANMLYLCVLDASNDIVLHRKIRARPRELLSAIKPYRDDVVVGAE